VSSVTYSTRIALGVEYDGSAFKGWQAQLDPAVPTVQETLEAALSRIADQSVRVNCAGRTDTGVHAAGQVVHFETTSDRLLKAWVQGANSLLPPQVCVRWAQVVAFDFHARFSAQSRHYRYCISNEVVQPALLGAFVTHYHHPLNAALMHEAGQALLGEHDFSAYRAQACQSRTPMRRVLALQVRRHGALVVVDIEANAFLLHMVRNIVGVLLEIGSGRRPPTWAGELLAGQDRTRAAVTAPPGGLSLVQVRYPAQFGLPQALTGMQQFPFWTEL
jgi:tRNA pseudouridine38-40 synthase